VIIEDPVIPTRTPVTRSLLGYHVRWGCPVARGRLNDTQLQHVLKLSASYAQAFGCETTRSSSDRRAVSLNVMCDIVLGRLVGELGLREGRELGQEGVKIVGRVDGLGVIAVEVTPSIRNWVKGSTRRVCFMSIRRLK